MPYINELQVACAQLPPDVCPTASADSPRFLAIVRDEGQPATVLGEAIPFIPPYQLIGEVCRHRAVLTVDDRLLVHGRPITPEAYLQRWRRALAQAVPFDRVPVQLAFRPVAVFVWRHTDAQRRLKPHWITPPYASFGELLDAHCQHTTVSIVDGQPQVRLEIDLTAPQGARDAWWADDYLANRSDRVAPNFIGIELRHPDATLLIHASTADRHLQPAVATHQATATL